jgi:hypothetical protein
LWILAVLVNTYESGTLAVLINTYEVLVTHESGTLVVGSFLHQRETCSAGSTAAV